jgi:hypothetical protein
MLDAQAKQWLIRLLGENVCFDEPMARHTSFRIGGPADVMVEPQTNRLCRYRRGDQRVGSRWRHPRVGDRIEAIELRPQMVLGSAGGRADGWCRPAYQNCVCPLSAKGLAGNEFRIGHTRYDRRRSYHECRHQLRMHG